MCSKKHGIYLLVREVQLSGAVSVACRLYRLTLQGTVLVWRWLPVLRFFIHSATSHCSFYRGYVLCLPREAMQARP